MTVLEERLMSLASTFFKKQISGEIDWEQRRYEIAKETFVVLTHAQWYAGSKEDAAECAVRNADTLIAELKKKEDKK